MGTSDLCGLGSLSGVAWASPCANYWGTRTGTGCKSADRGFPYGGPAACLEVDPGAVDVEHPVSDQRTPPPKTAGPPQGKTLSALLQPVPVPVPQQLAIGDAQVTPDKLPSPQRSEVPTSRAVRNPSPVVRSPYPKEVFPDVQMPAKVSRLTPATPVRPLVSRRGRPIIPPRGLMDYVP